MAFKLFSKKNSSKREVTRHTVKSSASKAGENRVVSKERRVETAKLADEKAYEIARRFKIPVAETFFVRNQAELETALKKVGFPCVMKISGDVVHKTEVGGVETNINDRVKATETFNRFIKTKGVGKVIVQRQMSGTELIVGSKKDSQFGYVIAAGLGGIFVETLKDVVFRVCPISLQDAEEMVRELKGFEILKGVRGMKPINFPSLYETLTKVSRLTISEKIKELDINPLFCDEHGCFAADIRIVK